MIKNITDLETQDIIRKFQKENYSYSECTLYEYEMKEMTSKMILKDKKNNVQFNYTFLPCYPGFEKQDTDKKGILCLYKSYREGYIEYYYILYTNEYGEYYYHDGKRTKVSYALNTDNEYVEHYYVDVPSPEEQFSMFLKEHPNAKYAVFYDSEPDNKYKNMAKVYGDIYEAVLISSYDSKNYTYRFIDSDRFSIECQYPPYNIACEERNPILAFKHTEQLKKERYKQHEKELYSYQEQYYYDNIENWHDIAKKKGKSILYDTIVNTIPFILGINIAALCDEKCEYTEQAKQTVNLFKNTNRDTDTEKLFDMYLSLLNEKLAAGRKILNKYLCELTGYLDIDYDKIFSYDIISEYLKESIVERSKSEYYYNERKKGVEISVEIENCIDTVMEKQFTDNADIKKLTNDAFAQLIQKVSVPRLTQTGKVRCIALFTYTYPRTNIDKLGFTRYEPDVYKRAALLIRENPHIIEYLHAIGRSVMIGYAGLEISDDDHTADEYKLDIDRHQLTKGLHIVEIDKRKKEISFLSNIYDVSVWCSFPDKEKIDAFHAAYSWGAKESGYKYFIVFINPDGKVNLKQLKYPIQKQFDVSFIYMRDQSAFIVASCNSDNVALASDYIKTNYNLENYNDYIFKFNSYSRVNEAALKRLKEKK